MEAGYCAETLSGGLLPYPLGGRSDAPSEGSGQPFRRRTLTPMWTRMGRRGRAAADAAVTLSAGAFTVVMLHEGGLGTAEPGYRSLDLPGVILAAATTVPLLFARRFPGFAWGVIAPASLILIFAGYGLDVPPGPLIAACVLAEAVGGGGTPRRRLLAAVSVAIYLPVAFTLMGFVGKSLTSMSSGMFAWAVMFALVWIAGDRSRLRHERILELEERARLREQEVAAHRRLAAAEERTRIARELHDSAGHAINVILVQAGAARLLHERDPERSRRAIATIEEVAHSTIEDIDRLVRALRATPTETVPAGSASARGELPVTVTVNDGAFRAAAVAGPAPATPVPVHPTPDYPAPAGTGALEQLVDRHRASGLQVAATFHGAPRGLPSGVAWAAYRILQEALTNAARHGSGSADVRMSYGPAAVDIVVSNPVADRSRPGGGMGIIGMKERAALLDGTLDAEAVDTGMFRLRARLPYAASASLGSSA